MYCKNCRKKIPSDSLFCPNCGIQIAKENTNKSNINDALHTAETLGSKVSTKASEFSSKASAKAADMLNSDTAKSYKKRCVDILKNIRKKRHTRYIIGIVALLIIGYFGINFLYMPHMVKNAVVKSGFDNTSYAIDANVFTKKITLTADRSKAINLVAAASGDDFPMGPIGAEEQLNALQAALPGDKWTVEIVQNDSKEDPHVLWAYSKGREIVRYQNSGVFQANKIKYQQAQAQESETSTAEAAAGGAIFGGLLGIGLSQ